MSDDPTPKPSHDPKTKQDKARKGDKHKMKLSVKTSSQSSALPSSVSVIDITHAGDEPPAQLLEILAHLSPSTLTAMPPPAISSAVQLTLPQLPPPQRPMQSSTWSRVKAAHGEAEENPTYTLSLESEGDMVGPLHQCQRINHF